MLTAALSLLLAQASNPYLETGRALARELKFAEAIAQLQVARQVPDLDGAQRLEVLELLARCHVAEGNRAEAEAAFSELLSTKPEHELDRDNTSPKIVAVFDEVKRRLYPDERVSLVEEAAPPGRVRARVVDPFRRVRGAVLVQRVGETSWTREALALEGRVVDVAVPTASGVESVAWYVELSDEAGRPVASLATADAPRVSPGRALGPPVAVGASTGDGLRGPRLAGLVAGGLAVIAVGVGTALQVSAQSLDRASRDATRPPGDWADSARATHAEAVTQAHWSIGLFVTGGVAAASATVLLLW